MSLCSSCRSAVCHSGIVTGAEAAVLRVQHPGTSEPEDVTVPPYSFLLFHGRLLHSGTCYADKRTRVHFFIGDRTILAGIVKLNGLEFFNGTDLTDRMTSLRWYDP